MSTYEEWFVETYDQIVRDSGVAGINLRDSEELVAQAYEKAIESGDLQRPDVDLNAEGRVQFKLIVRRERNKRKASLLNDMEGITAALADETVLGHDDPILARAYSTGSNDGLDKVVGLWTVEDWRSAMAARQQNASKAVAAQQIFDEQASIIIRQMQSAHAYTTAAMFAKRRAA